MTISVRGATPADFPAIRHLIETAFSKGTIDEAPLFDYLTGVDPTFKPEHIRIALKDNEVAACSIVAPRQIRTRFGWAPGGIVTIVATRPDLQKQGYGSAAVQDTLRYMAENGMAFGILYGVEFYYPRFGFAKVFAMTEIIWDAAGGSEVLEQAGPADLSRLNDLYHADLGTYPCAVARVAEPWNWANREPGLHSLVTLGDRSAYAFFSWNEKESYLDVHDVGAQDAAATRRLLDGLCREAGSRGLAQVRLLMPPDALAARVASVCYGVQRKYRFARFGMAAVVDWAPLLPPGYAVTEEGLTYEGDLQVQATRAELIQLVLGYRSGADLALMGHAVAERVLRDFPPAFPRWTLAPYWHGQ